MCSDHVPVLLSSIFYTRFLQALFIAICVALYTLAYYMFTSMLNYL